MFINALLRMLTVAGQNENISHGLQIGKDQKGDNQREMTTVINSTAQGSDDRRYLNLC